MKQVEIVYRCIEKLGGKAKYADIYKEYEFMTGKQLSVGQKAGIRKTIEMYSSDSEEFSYEDIFYSVEGKHRGVWGIRESNKNFNKLNSKHGC